MVLDAGSTIHPMLTNIPTAPTSPPESIGLLILVDFIDLYSECDKLAFRNVLLFSPTRYIDARESRYLQKIIALQLQTTSKRSNLKNIETDHNSVRDSKKTARIHVLKKGPFEKFFVIRD